MNLETTNSFNGMQRIVALFGIIFCTVVAVVLVIHYYPADSVEKEFDDDFSKVTSADDFKDRDFNTENKDASKTRVEDVAKALEDFGAAFLVLVAVCCVSVGLTCLFCACCILK